MLPRLDRPRARGEGGSHWNGRRCGSSRTAGCEGDAEREEPAMEEARQAQDRHGMGSAKGVGGDAPAQRNIPYPVEQGAGSRVESYVAGCDGVSALGPAAAVRVAIVRPQVTQNFHPSSSSVEQAGHCVTVRS